MKWPMVYRMLLTAAFVSLCTAGVSRAGELRAWGLDRDGQVKDVPAGSDYVAVAAGDAHGLALRSDGVVVAWGQNDDGECQVPAGTYKAIGAGADFSLAIRPDGSIAAWGYDGQRQVSGVPAGRDFVAVDGGELFAVALRVDGSLVAWGDDQWGQVSDVPTGKDFKAVVAGDDHALALRTDGSLVAWGYGAATEGAPTSGVFTAIAAGGDFSVALKDDGSLVWWGDVHYGLGVERVPPGADYVEVAAGYLHALALKRDGSLLGWGAGTTDAGHPNWGQAMPPAGNDYTAVACGLYFSLALTGKADPNDPVEPNDPPVSAVVADDFNDNRLGSLWKPYGEDLSSCWLEETNQRLELMTTARAQGISAYAVSTDWRIDPSGDFAFKVSYHYDLVTDNGGWVFLGLTPDVNDLYTRYIKFGVGCDRQYTYVWYELIDGQEKRMDFNNRRESDGQLYVSYDAGKDELYLGSHGYGSNNAWTVISDVLPTSWRGVPVEVFLGGGANGLEVRSGSAWLDDFVVDAAELSRPSLNPISEVYRFWSPVIERHFFTINPAERDKLIRDYPDVWTYEGPAYKAATSAFEAGLAPVYRFWSPTGQSHFYTIDPVEKDQLIERYADVWSFEGVVFYAFPENAQPVGALPVYRFWKPSDNSYFYTMKPAEKDKLIREYAHVFTYQGVAFYAYEL